MSVSSERFELALKSLKATDWARFERLASVFLQSDFPAIRTVATPSGDGGRDAELFQPAGSPYVFIQYSVNENWRQKVKDTAERLEESFPGQKTIIYTTNHQIGASADKLKTQLLVKNVFLDVRDINWFIDRLNTSPERVAAAHDLAKVVVDPLLDKIQDGRDSYGILSSSEAKTALFFLEMQALDSNKNYGLTKSSFDALVRAALRATSTESRMTRAQIYDEISRFLPSHRMDDLKPRVDAALNRLSQSAVRRRKDKDEFHLLDEERGKLLEKSAKIAAMRASLDLTISDVAKGVLRDKLKNEALFVEVCRSAIETYYLVQGEMFASATLRNERPDNTKKMLSDVAISLSGKDIGVANINRTRAILDVVSIVLSTADGMAEDYLISLIESYTLFAFLAATPDVQRATRKLFASGELWLDTNIILPVLAEQSYGERFRPFTAMLRQAKSAGLRLYVTKGVIEELEGHFRLCKSFLTTPNWKGRVPYLYSAYVVAGGKRETFLYWIENFVGSQEPFQDICESVRRISGIIVEDATNWSNISEELIAEVQEEWRKIHDKRHPEWSEISKKRLADHDSENFLHVLSSRMAQVGRAPLGYSDWWLTTDGAAREILDNVSPEVRPTTPIGPVMSLDFLIRYLMFGPNREKLDVNTQSLSAVYSREIIESVPEELLEVARGVRERNSHLEEHIIVRRIRESLNAARGDERPIDGVGLDGFDDAVRGVM